MNGLREFILDDSSSSEEEEDDVNFEMVVIFKFCSFLILLFYLFY
jgi:hypothetical protein